MFSAFSECVFCGKPDTESELIEMSTNSLVLDDEIIEFSDLIRSCLISFKVQNESTASICEQCKNLLVQFFIFKQQLSTNPNLLENTNVTKVLSFLDENEDEDIFCTRYNKCFTLVPESKRKFNEVFQQWQPHVIMDTIEQLPEPPPKRQKLEISIEEKSITFIANEIADIKEIKTVQQKQEKEEDIKVVQQAEEEEGISENDWAQMEIDNCEVIETDNGATWLCKYCEPGPVSFPVIEDFRNHLLTTHLTYEQVGVQEIETESEEVIMEDYDNDETEQSDSENRDENPQIKFIVPEMFQCPHCEYAISNRSEFKIHQKLHQSSRFEKLLCIDCSYQFTTQAHYQAHLNGHQLYEIVAKHSNFPICEICNSMFSDETFEKLHREKHNDRESINELISIPHEGAFLKYGHHRSDLEIQEKEFPKGCIALSCGHCSKQFHDEESCRLHQLIFHCTSLTCPIENRVFKGNQAFSIHLKNNHPELFGDEVKFLCSVCKTVFKTLYDKLKHMKTCDQKKFECTHCDKRFSQKCYLTNHLRLVSGQSSVTCEICDKVCRDKGDYQIHARSHSNIKPFPCSLCPKAYKTSSARSAHLETHNEDGFDCLYCTVKCKSRRTLQKHVKTKHPSKHKAANEID